MSWHVLGKSAGEPGLEIADFVMQAAGTQVRGRERGNETWRKDFAAIFHHADPTLVEFAGFTSVVRQHNPHGTIPAVLIDPTSRRIERPSR